MYPRESSPEVQGLTPGNSPHHSATELWSDWWQAPRYWGNEGFPRCSIVNEGCNTKQLWQPGGTWFAARWFSLLWSVSPRQLPQTRVCTAQWEHYTLRPKIKLVLLYLNSVAHKHRWHKIESFLTASRSQIQRWNENVKIFNHMDFVTSCTASVTSGSIILCIKNGK